MDYKEFLEKKKIKYESCGFGVELDSLNKNLFDFQKAIVRWSLKKGKAAIFADCGLGKTIMQLEWAKQIDKNILIVAPLAVSKQTIDEGKKFDIDVTRSIDGKLKSKITITNYEQLHKFDMSKVDGIVLDESSILKNYSGKYRNEIIENTRNINYKLACTATPAPNDFMELGNHSEFLGALKRTEMLSMFFIHDSANTQSWRLKAHATRDFWQWICSWAIMMSKPSDIGYNDEGFILPKINIKEHIVNSDQKLDGELFAVQAKTLQERQYARRSTIEKRSDLVANIVSNNEPAIVWCNLNDESNSVKLKSECIEIKGSDSDDYKSKMMIGFKYDDPLKLVTKPKIAGLGMNWQHCNNVVFLGLSDSYEQYYQAVRRCWRFGQKKEVNVHIVVSDIEGSVIENIKRKENDAKIMREEMIKNMCEITKKEIELNNVKIDKYQTKEVIGNNWKITHGDSVEEIKNIESDSIGLSVFSPPFAELYVYNDTVRDLGNSKNYGEFFDHFDFIVKELHRIMMAGRSVVFHCTDIPMMKERDGKIGLKDFPGDLIRLFQKHGFIYHSKTTIWKDPLIEATRTKALGLMHKQIQKDSSRCRCGLPDYIIAMRKDGENKSPIDHPDGFTEFIGENEPTEMGIKYSHITWQKYASPVWMDIRQTNTLNKNHARGENDEKHICPLQLDTIERVLSLWSKEGDTVFSPFAGIGSEGYCSIKMGRKFIGIELKESYFNQAVKNLNEASECFTNDLFQQAGLVV